MYAPIAVSWHLENYVTLKVSGFYTPYTQTQIVDDYFYLLKCECLRFSVIASVSYLYTNIYLQLTNTEKYARTHHRVLILSSGWKWSTLNSSDFYTPYTQIRIEGICLILTDNNCIMNCPMKSIWYLYTYIYNLIRHRKICTRHSQSSGIKVWILSFKF